MEVIPKLRVIRFDKLERAELCIYADEGHRSLAFCAYDPQMDGDSLVLLIDPSATKEDRLRIVSPGHDTVIGLGTDYVIRLPVSADGWSIAEPSQASCITLTHEGHVFFRANFGGRGENFRPCWVDARDGRTVYYPPPGIKAFALKWDIISSHPTEDHMALVSMT